METFDGTSAKPIAPATVHGACARMNALRELAAAFLLTPFITLTEGHYQTRSLQLHCAPWTQQKELLQLNSIIMVKRWWHFGAPSSSTCLHVGMSQHMVQAPGGHRKSTYRNSSSDQSASHGQLRMKAVPMGQRSVIRGWATNAF